MKAIDDGTQGADAHQLRRQFYSWGETWSGSKSQLLQAAGIQADILFPGEPGGPIRECSFRDQLGLKVRIRRSFGYEHGSFRATRRYRDRDELDRLRRAQRTTVLPNGVKHYRNEWATDTFTGTAAGLIALGLAKADEFPGQPGRGKGRVSYRADGSQARAGDPRPRRGGSGSRVIFVAGKTTFSIEVFVDQDERSLRAQERALHDEEVARLDSEARAHVCTLEERLGTRAAEPPALKRNARHLRLVWSRP